MKSKNGDQMKFSIGTGRLTPEGWLRGDGFFSQPVPPPRKISIGLMSKDYSVEDLDVKGKHASVFWGYEYLGRINSELRYTEPNPRTLKYQGIYHLTLTNVYWELQPDGKTLKEVTTTTPEWRIDDPVTLIFLIPETAVQYVLQIRDKTTDPVIKKNADKTISKLKQYR